MTGATPIRAHGNYAPASLAGRTVVSAGMTPRVDGKLAAAATVGDEDRPGQISVERAAELAGLSVERALQACREVLPETARLVRAVSLTVYVRSAPDFDRHSEVADGASRVLADEFENGVPARAAVGVSSLPGGAPVEVVLTAEWSDGAVGAPA